MCGMPGIIIGRNEHIAWGVTLASIDVEDLFVERFITNTGYEYQGRVVEAVIRNESINVKGRSEPHVEYVREVRGYRVL